MINKGDILNAPLEDNIEVSSQEENNTNNNPTEWILYGSLLWDPYNIFLSWEGNNSNYLTLRVIKS